LALAPPAASPPAGPRVFSPSSPLLSPAGAAPGTRTADAMVPPVARKRPKSEPAVADDAARGKAKPVASPVTTVAEAPAAPVAANPAAPRPQIDHSSRSALGAPLPAAEPKSCPTGQKLDARTDKCVKKAPDAAEKASARKSRARGNGEEPAPSR
jgi:hypothetical protein